MRKLHLLELGFAEPSAVTKVLGHVVLGVREVAIGASPAVEGKQLLGSHSCLSHLLAVTTVHVNCTTASVLDSCGLFLFFLIILVVKFLNPALDATQMEWLMALITVPESTPLVDRVVADYTLLGSLGQTLHEECALLGQVAKLLYEIHVVVSDLGPILVCLLAPVLFFIYNLDLFLLGNHEIVIGIAHVVSRRAQVSRDPDGFALLLVLFATPHPLIRLRPVQLGLLRRRQNACIGVRLLRANCTFIAITLGPTVAEILGGRNRSVSCLRMEWLRFSVESAATMTATTSAAALAASVSTSGLFTASPTATSLA